MVRELARRGRPRRREQDGRAMEHERAACTERQPHAVEVDERVLGRDLRDVGTRPEAPPEPRSDPRQPGLERDAGEALEQARDYEVHLAPGSARSGRPVRRRRW
jgi:hypothetical protein